MVISRQMSRLATKHIETAIKLELLELNLMHLMTQTERLSGRLCSPTPEHGCGFLGITRASLPPPLPPLEIQMGISQQDAPFCPSSRIPGEPPHTQAARGSSLLLVYSLPHGIFTSVLFFFFPSLSRYFSVYSLIDLFNNVVYESLCTKLHAKCRQSPYEPQLSPNASLCLVPTLLPGHACGSREALRIGDPCGEPLLLV